MYKYSQVLRIFKRWESVTLVYKIDHKGNYEKEKDPIKTSNTVNRDFYYKKKHS